VKRIEIKGQAIAIHGKLIFGQQHTLFVTNGNSELVCFTVCSKGLIDVTKK
jgi:hypothetical protein